MYRTTFIEQLFPLFTRIEKLNDKRSILNVLCEISTNSIHHVLDPLSIFNTFKPGKFKNSPFIQKFGSLIHGLYPFASCITTREYHYLLRPFIQHLIPSTISRADLLNPFELAILSNKFSFGHFLGYMNSFLPLMKKENLTASALGLNEINIRSTLGSLGAWNVISLTSDEMTRLFYLCLKDMCCVLLLLEGSLTREQFNTVIQRILTEK
jgi:hypothetical protein